MKATGFWAQHELFIIPASRLVKKETKADLDSVREVFHGRGMDAPEHLPSGSLHNTWSSTGAEYVTRGGRS